MYKPEKQYGGKRFYMCVCIVHAPMFFIFSLFQLFTVACLLIYLYLSIKLKQRRKKIIDRLFSRKTSQNQATYEVNFNSHCQGCNRRTFQLFLKCQKAADMNRNSVLKGKVGYRSQIQVAVEIWKQTSLFSFYHST